MSKEFFSNFGIDDEVSFRPMFRHQTAMGIADQPLSGKIVAVRFTKAKVFYDILDDYRSVVFDGVDSVKVWREELTQVPDAAHQ